MTNKNIPELRFEGFEDDWEQRKLGDLADEFKSGYSIKAENIFDEGEYPVYGGNGIRGFTDTFNHEGEFALIGRQGALSGNMNFSANKAYFTEHAIAVRANNMNDTRFLYFLLCKLQLGRWVTQSAQPGLAVGTLVEIRTQIPGKAKEQQKIGAFFKQLDDTIALHQRKLEQLETLKKGYLQRLFPQNGEKVPRVRFADFEGDWEERKLGELVKITTGKLDANAMIENGVYDFYTSGIKKYRIDTPAFEGPAITIAGNGATVGYMHLADGKFNAYQRTYVIVKFQSDRLFLFYQIKKHLPKKIQEEARAGNIPYIVMSMLTDLIIDLSKYESEQVQVGFFLKRLDNIIYLYEQKLEKLNLIKKSFLQKMFI